MDVLLKLRVGPEVGGDQEELLRAPGVYSRHVEIGETEKGSFVVATT